MKLAAKFKLFALGLAVTTATSSVSAMPILRNSGSEMSLMTICELNVLNGVDASLCDTLKTENVLLLQAKAAQDMIADLVGLPMLGIDGIDATDMVAQNTDLNALVASILGNDGVDSDEALSELADAVDADTMYLLGTHGSGGGATYGGAHANLRGGAPIGNTGHASHKSIHGGGGFVSPSVVVPTIISNDGTAISGNTTGSTVPLPSGALAGLVLLGTLGGVYKLRSSREVVA